VIFAPTDPAKIVKNDLYEARRQLLEHQKFAEYHEAMTGMLKARIARLEVQAAESSQQATAAA